MPFTIAVDLAFELERPGQSAVRGHLSSEGGEIVLDVSDPAAFAGAGDASTVRTIAETLAAGGLVVRVVHDDQHVLSLGAVSAPWWQRRVTGSRRIRVASLRGAWTSAKARARRTPSVLPVASLMPPLTLFPLVPTLGGVRRQGDTTTTHDPEHGGDPRLVLIRPISQLDRSPVFWLHRDEITLGSDSECDVLLEGLEPLHARIRHDEDDEWVIDAIAGLTRVHGGAIVSQRLRTGSMIQVGIHQLAFFREEYADHGRPYGGRVGGELGRNTPQPRRTTRSEPRAEPPTEPPAEDPESGLS